MPALSIRFQEEDLEVFYAWEEELENDLEAATGSNASVPDGTGPSVSDAGIGMVLVALGVIAGILLVDNWRFRP